MLPFLESSFSHKLGYMLFGVSCVHFSLYLLLHVCCWYMSFFPSCLPFSLSYCLLGHFRDEDAASFVLVEPPSFFLLSIASVILMSYGFCLYCLKTHVQQVHNFFFLHFTFCILHFAFFFFGIIVYNFLHPF